MGMGEESTHAKPHKPISSTQEMPATLYPDWSNSMQAYYGAAATPPPFFASTVASPTPHPYLWGGQHPLMPPYGTPVPYPALYPAGGLYTHPNMATTPNPVRENVELEGKGPEIKDRASARKSKGAPGDKVVENGKAVSGSGNDGSSQSAESDSEDSSDTSDENTNRQEFAASKKGSFKQMLADANAKSNTTVPAKPVVSMPATNLNIGMDFLNTSSVAAAAGATKMRPNAGMPDQWIHDERELKRQKRKQSNRESARRSRIRKQAECEELQTRVENLSSDNVNLRDELQRLSEECEKLKSENDSIKEDLTRLFGPDAVANLEQRHPSSAPSPSPPPLGG